MSGIRGWEVRVDDEIVYLATDFHKFMNTVRKHYANVSNAKLYFAGEPIQLVR